MKIENNYYIWNKGDTPEWMGNWFKSNEFSCKCNNRKCIEQKINVDLVKILDKVRDECRVPLRITSAYRCTEHQESLRKQGVNTVVAKKSTHELGDAVDVCAPSLKIGDFTKIIEKYFINVGYAMNFVHVDMRLPKPDGSGRKWTY